MPLPGQIAVFRNNGLEKRTVLAFALFSPASVARHIHLVLYWSLFFSIAGHSLIGRFCLSFKKKEYICKGNPWEACHLTFWQNVFHNASKGVQRWALRNASTYCEFTCEVALRISLWSSQSSWAHTEFSCPNLKVSARKLFCVIKRISCRCKELCNN